MEVIPIRQLLYSFTSSPCDYQSTELAINMFWFTSDTWDRWQSAAIKWLVEHKLSPLFVGVLIAHCSLTRQLKVFHLQGDFLQIFTENVYFCTSHTLCCENRTNEKNQNKAVKMKTKCEQCWKFHLEIE